MPITALHCLPIGLPGPPWSLDVFWVPSFPILGYDDLTAAQVQARLDDLSPAQLRKVRDYERRNANRTRAIQSGR